MGEKEARLKRTEENRTIHSVLRGTMLVIATLLAFCAVPGIARAADFNHAPWERVLQKYVNDQGRVDYAVLKANPAQLDAYAAALAARSPRSHPADFPTSESQLAYWINAYNALTVAGVVENWRVTSVRKIGWLPFAFFRNKKFSVGGRLMTLDDIENILRKELREPRIHFAIVCASNNCRHLGRRVYTAENANALLDEAARAYGNVPRNLSIDATRNRATIPGIFKWFREDFEEYARRNNLSVTGNPPLDFLRQFADDANRRAIDVLKNPSVSYFDHDWGINDLHAPVDNLKAVKPGGKE
jgi:hypothetical protein